MMRQPDDRGKARAEPRAPGSPPAEPLPSWWGCAFRRNVIIESGGT
jgi:hypothetical protein